MNFNLRMLSVQDTATSLLVAAVVLVIGFLYGLAHVYRVPDPGFSYNGRWSIVSFSDSCRDIDAASEDLICNTGRDALEVGDVILRIYGPGPNEDLTNQDYNTDLTATPFLGFEPGDVVRMDIVRDGAAKTVAWLMPPRSNPNQLQGLSTLWVFLPFWLAGTAVLLFLRPKDTRWRLLILQNYVTGLWLAVGTVSYSQIFGSVYLSISLSWLIMPVYLHLHLLLPRPLGLRGRWWIPALYGVSGLMALLNLSGVFPVSTYYLALFVGIGGSIFLLLMRLMRPASPSERSALNLMLLGIGISLMPGILLFLLPSLVLDNYTAAPLVTVLATVAIPILSFFYTYTLYKHRLGDQEVRANRALAAYSFAILYSTFFVLTFVLAGQRIHLPPEVYANVIILATIYTLVAFAVRPIFERFMNRVVYGTAYDPERIVQQFANEIPRALNPTYLSSLLTNQVMPSLLIRQSALCWVVEETGQWVYTEQTPELPPVLGSHEIDGFRSYFRIFLNEDDERTSVLPDSFQWVRLVIPIELDARFVGLWLFGRRDPDDFYPQRDIELLTTLGSQVGIALESTRLFAIEQHRADELERTNFELHRVIRVKNDMLRNISHELRTPLTAISGYTDLLIDGVAGELTSDQNELLSIVADRANDLRSMINDLITYQQDRAQEIEMGAANIAEVAQAALQTARTLASNPNYAGAHPHTFVLDCATEPLYVRANVAQLNQVFNNLLSNAVKFSPEGGQVTITIRSGNHRFVYENRNAEPSIFSTEIPEVEEIELPAVFISVQDEGIGIPSDELENIWLDFYQVDGSATRRFGGTGLGLALVRDIVQAHGGTISAVSQVGIETIITFILPRTEPG